VIKISLVFIFSLICNGCASSSANNSKFSKFTPPVNNNSVKYSKIKGCRLLKNGYLVCPKKYK